MRTLSKHAEWLSLVEIAGPFLTVSMLEQAFPQGLDAVATSRRQRLRAAYDEWRDAVDEGDELLPELHGEWVRLVLTELLEYDHESLVPASNWSDGLPIVSSQENAGSFSPDWIVSSPRDSKPRLFVAVVPPDIDLQSVQRGDAWPASLQERMTLLCRTYGTRIGLLTNGERWILVNAPIGSTSGYASWYARLWFQEPVTLQAFQSLLGVRRCFGPIEERLELLLEESLKHQEDLTDTLGEQVRRAVEVLVQCLDKADEDRNRELLRGVSPADLYEAGLTVMMRLVFLLCAEERGLLLSGDPVYDTYYAVSTLRGQLAEEADRHGPEVLDRRHDAWVRLLAIFRTVYGGAEHENLRIPAMGGSLFDPDRFPFLEGRTQATCWRDTAAAPLPIDNRTVLLLLNSLQILEQSSGALLLSYRALDIEQIGHVYEGLLEHTVERTPRLTLGLLGSQKARNPSVALAELESARLDSDIALTKLIAETTSRSDSAIRNSLSKPVDEALFGRLLGVCGGDTELANRVRPFVNLLRLDAWEDPIVYRTNSFMVTLGTDRRETGTHYTPKSLTESLVTTTLEPLVYIGPVEGKPQEEWVLRESREILNLKVCDPAMGSGAFLVQACRYLGEKLVESWFRDEESGKTVTLEGETGDGLVASELMPVRLDERLISARRLIAERCLYGVDINPLAVELAKLSIWLVTLSKGRPFGFLDHNLRHGDSLLGIHRLDQLTRMRLHPGVESYQLHLFGQKAEAAVKNAFEIRSQIRSTPIGDIRDVEAMARLNRQAGEQLKAVDLIADALVGEVLRAGRSSRGLEVALKTLSACAGDYLNGNEKMGRQILAQANESLATHLPPGRPRRKPLHWVLEFPEVFARGGFDAIIGNPPFLGNRLWKRMHGERLQWQCQMVLGEPPGQVDLCVVFHRRATDLLRPGGSYGLLAPSNIAEGSAISVGLATITRCGDIYFSRKGLPWPGKAAVFVAMICFYKGAWVGPKHSNGSRCERIGPRLEPESEFSWEPKELKSALFSFEGVNNSKGMAFIVDRNNPWFTGLKDESRSLLRPYITGDDITSSALTRVDRFALDISGFDDIRQIEDRWPYAYRFLMEIVRPTRTPEVLKNYPEIQHKWWKFVRPRIELMSRLRRSQLCISYSKNTKYPIGILAPSEWIYTNKVLLIGLERENLYALSLSTGFRDWLENFCGGRLGETLTLSISESIAKYPVPSDTISSVGTKASYDFNEILGRRSASRGFGLTAVLNDVHTPDQGAPETVELRQLLELIDREVVTAYGWTDLDMTYEFRTFTGGSINDRWRWSLSDITRSELQSRLIALNRERYELEANHGLPTRNPL